MQTKQSELFFTQENVENSHKQNYPLIEREQIKNTPFTLIHQEGKWLLTIGNIKITEPTETKEEQIQKLDEEKWMITLSLIAWTIERTEQIKKLEGGFDPNK